jgi:hypothetical protein
VRRLPLHRGSLAVRMIVSGSVGRMGVVVMVIVGVIMTVLVMMRMRMRGMGMIAHGGPQ